jgi:hypothetical protein
MRAARQLFSAASVAAVLAFGTFVAQPAAQTRPKDATAQCKDGTYSTAKTKRGACSGHGGVTTWFADEDTKSNAKAAKADTKTAAKETKEAAKSAGAATKEGTKAAAKDTKDAAKSVAKTVAKPSGSPEDATAKCKDGTYSHSKQHRGACSNHGGVAEWYK